MWRGYGIISEIITRQNLIKASVSPLVLAGAHNTKEHRTSITILWYQSHLRPPNGRLYLIWEVPSAHGFVVFLTNHMGVPTVGAYVNDSW